MKYSLFPFLLLIVLSCNQQEPKTESEPEPIADTIVLPEIKDSFFTINIGGRECDVAAPFPGTVYRGNILILQGYNFPKHDWCEKAPDLCRKARANGYYLIMPEMGKSLYSDSFYAETAGFFKSYPLRNFLTDSLIPELQKNYKLFREDQPNFVLGLSSGARGGALLILENPELYRAAALLSGDYDQRGIPNDQLMILYYGAYESQKTRWEETDNIIREIDKWKTPLYLGHAKNDAIVPHAQSKQFYDSLKTRLKEGDLFFNEPEMGHDYKYWGSETDAVLNFFDSKSKK